MSRRYASTVCTESPRSSRRCATNASNPCRAAGASPSGSPSPASGPGLPSPASWPGSPSTSLDRRICRPSLRATQVGGSCSRTRVGRPGSWTRACRDRAPAWAGCLQGGALAGCFGRDDQSSPSSSPPDPPHSSTSEHGFASGGPRGSDDCTGRAPSPSARGAGPTPVPSSAGGTGRTPAPRWPAGMSPASTVGAVEGGGAGWVVSATRPGGRLTAWTPAAVRRIRPRQLEVEEGGVERGRWRGRWRPPGGLG